MPPSSDEKLQRIDWSSIDGSLASLQDYTRECAFPMGSLCSHPALLLMCETQIMHNSLAKRMRRRAFPVASICEINSVLFGGAFWGIKSSGNAVSEDCLLFSSPFLSRGMVPRTAAVDVIDVGRLVDGKERD